MGGTYDADNVDVDVVELSLATAQGSIYADYMFIRNAIANLGTYPRVRLRRYPNADEQAGDWGDDRESR